MPRQKKDARLRARRSDKITTRWQALIAVSGQIIWTTAPDGNVVNDIPGWRAFTGQTAKEVYGMGWVDAIHPDDRGRVIAAWQTAINECQTYEIQYRLRRADGVYRIFSVRGVPVVDAAGNVKEWVGVHQDVTEQQRLELEHQRLLEWEQQARTEAEQRARQIETIFDTITDGVIVYDVYGNIVMANPAIRELFKAGEIEGLLAMPIDKRYQWLNLLDREGKKLSLEHTPQMRILSGESFIGETIEELTLQRYDGSTRDVSISGGPIRSNVSGIITGAVLILRDVTERKQREREEQARASQIETIFNAITECVMVLDTHGKIIMTNPASREVFQAGDIPGYWDMSVEERYALSYNIDQEGNKLPIEESPHIRILNGESLIGNTIQEFTLRRHDGSTRDISVSGVPIRGDTSDTITGAVLIARDVTERKQQEREEQARAREIETIFNAVTDGIYLYDAEGHVVRMNPAAQAFHTAMKLDVTGKTLDERFVSISNSIIDHTGRVLSVDQLPASRLLQGETLTGNNSMDIIVQMLDGKQLPLNIVGTPMYESNGRLTGAIALFRDMSGQRLLEHQLRISFDALLEMAQLLVATPKPGTDEVRTIAERLIMLSCNILQCSSSLLFTYNREAHRMELVAAIGVPQKATDCIVEAMQDEVLYSLMKDSPSIPLLLAGEIVPAKEIIPPQSVIDIDFVNERGFLVPLLWREQFIGLIFLALRENHTELTSHERQMALTMAHLAVLVIERARLQTEHDEVLVESRALHEVNRQLDELINIVGHELKTPLTSIKGGIQLTHKRLQRLRTNPPSDLITFVDGLLSLLGRTDTYVDIQTRLINDLLDSSRLQSGKMSMHFAECDLVALVKNACDLLALSWQGRKIVIDELPQCPINVRADAMRIGQVLTNFLVNAFKYTPTSQPVSVIMSLEDDHVQIAVRDFGPGISEANQQRIWQRFYRVPGIETQKTQVSLGLGLYICRLIIEHHGGEIGVISQLGHGATFWFKLPLSKDSQA
jgi:PAS domain S-box-containing protein